MTIVDTSVLLDCFTGQKNSAPALRRAVESGERLLVPALVLYEWARGPRRKEELAIQEAIFPSSQALPFGAEESAIAVGLYRRLRPAWGREIDLAIAACALARDAGLWTLNPNDFRDIPGLRLTSF